MSHRKICRETLYFLTAVVLGSSLCSGQQSRGTILGRVVDPSGGVVARAKVQATNVARKTVASSVTNEAGSYEMPFLWPGTYQVTVEAAGFNKSVREGIQVQMDDRLSLNFTLKVGDVAQAVVVTGDTSLLDATTASLGTLVEGASVANLPVKGGNPLYLMRLTAGVTAPSRGNGQNPFDAQAGTTTLNVNGVRGGSNEVLLDGATNLSQQGNTYSPPADLVQEYKIHTADYDASLGHAAGAITDMTMKSGTNALHGTAYFFDSRIVANLWFSDNFLYNPATGPITPQKRQQANPGRVNQRIGFTLLGPVFIPGLYDGRNRTFFTFGSEPRVYEKDPSAYTGTVPTVAERQGDFSALLKLGSQYQIYDPATILPTGSGTFSRQPFPGNIIPANRISAIAQNLLNYWSLPNQPGLADGTNNYYAVPASDRHWHSNLIRIDRNFTDKNRFFVRFNEFAWDLTQNYNLPTIAFGDNTGFKGRGGIIDDVYVFNPQLLLDVRYGMNYEATRFFNNSAGFDLSSLGFPQSLISEIGTKDNPAGMAFPKITADSYTGMNPNTPYLKDTYYQTLAGTVTKLAGNHSIRMGAEFRVDRENGINYGDVSPSLTFGTTWTQGPLNTSGAAPLGQGLASMLLGLPTAGQVDINPYRTTQSTFTALFVQDDWRITPRLTLNVGLRYEYEGPITDRYNESVRGFDFTTPSPIAQQAQANYALAPIPQVPVSAFKAIGGLTFGGVNSQPRGLWDPSKTNFAPRVGLAYQLRPRTVLRAGYGIFYDSQGVDRQSVNQIGFSQSTSLVSSLNNGQSFVGTLSNPFPNGLQLPTGAAAGLQTYLGRSVSFFNPDMPNPSMQRWSFSVQQELPKQFVLEVAYVGNRSTHLAVTRQLDAIPRQYLSTSPVRDQATINLLGTQVANPFYGIPQFAGTSLGNATVALSSLLVPYPQFTGVSESMPTGFSYYHSLQLTGGKRFSNGLSIHPVFTWSKWMEATSYLNATDPTPVKAISSNDYPYRFTVNGVYELPIGKGKPLLGNARGVLNLLVGGWQLESNYEKQSGVPLGFGNAIFTGNLNDIPLPNGQRSISEWFNVNAGFNRISTQQLASNIQTLSPRFSSIRAPGFNYFDSAITRNFPVREGVKAQFRFDAYNALNHVQFSAPNTSPTSSAFGTITSEFSDGQRQLYFGLKVLF